MKHLIIWLSILLIFIQEVCFCINPVRDYLNTPTALKLQYEQNIIHTTDGKYLNSWTILPMGTTDKNTVIIFAYGDSGNMSYWLHHAQLFSSKGFTVVLFDYRGFGKSSNFAINNEFLHYNQFADDLISIIKWTKKKFEGKRIGIYAFSMGTIMATVALQKESLDFYIAESLVYSPEYVVVKISKLKNKVVLLPEIKTMSKDLYLNINCKMLVFSGKLDNVTTLESSKIVVSQNKNRKLIEFNGNHGQAIQSLGDIYIKAILNFLS